MALSDIALRNAKPDRIRTIKLSDGGGLQLWITPAGSKLWYLAYRFDGKQRKLAIGAYPVVTLAGARERREWAKGLLASGIDPMEQKRADQQAESESRSNTFSVIAAELLDKKRREGKASATIGKREWLYGLANADLGNRPIATITAREVLNVLQGIESKGLHETARRLRSAIGEVFRFAVATSRAETDPTLVLRGALTAPVVQHRAAITDPVAFGGLLRAIDTFSGQPTTKAALQLMALLFPRPGELRQALWTEIDLERAIWTVPPSRMKMRREHHVPLPAQAVAILTALHPLTGFSPFVFPAIGNPRRPLSENTLNGALRRMGFGQEEMTSHGFRSTASTLLNESGRWSPDAIERALAHQDSDEIRRAYNRSAYWQERVEMAQWWADYLDTLRDGA